MDIAPPQAEELGVSDASTDVLESAVPPAPEHHARPRRWLRRRWLVIGGAVVVVAAAVGVWFGLRSGPSAAAPTYQQVAARTGTMQQFITTTGTLQPAQQANLSFLVSGQVASVGVQLGQHVSAGQTLATVTSASLAAQVAQAQATLANDQAKLSADQAAGASGAQITADQAAVTAAQASLSNSQQSLSDATLTSPIDGTVAQLNLSVGQQVTGSSGSSGSSGGSGGNGGGSGGSGSGGSANSNSSSSGASSAQVVVVGTAFTVSVSIDDTQIGLLKNGEQALIVPQGGGGQVFGTVSSVGLLATTTSGVSTFPVVITVTGTPSGLYAGATATVAIVYRQLSNVVEVPTAALHYSGGKASVQEWRNNQIVSVPVTVGAISQGYAQITSGLSDGDQVLVQQQGSPRPSGAGGGGNGNRGGGGFGGAGGLGGGGFGGAGGLGGGGGGNRPGG